MKGYILTIVHVLLLIFINKQILYGQYSPEKVFTISHQANCAETLEQFKSKFNVLVAYNPALSLVPSIGNRTLRANSHSELFSKVCMAFSLEHIVQQDNTFMVRSDAKEISESDTFVMHINIMDQLTGQPIEFATVYDPTKQYFGFTDIYGDCFIRLPKSLKGSTLSVHSLAHLDQEVVIAEKVNFNTVRLTADPIKVIPVTISTIKRKLSFAKQQGIFVDSTMLQHLNSASVFGNDVFRSVQWLPGVNSTNDASATIRIRGANDDATLLMLDNMPIYKADHFFGIFGAFNSFYIHDFTLFKNNIPAEYGGRLSGMLRLNSNPISPKPILKVDVNLLNTSVMADIPIGKYLHWKVATRTTYTDLIQTDLYDLSQRERLENDPKSQSLIVSRPSFNFYDANTRLVFKKGNHTLDLNGFLSNDLFRDRYNLSFRIKQNVVNDEKFEQESRWKNLAAGINYTYRDQNIILKSNLYHTQHQSIYDINSDLVRRELSGWIRDTVTINNNNKIADFGGKFSAKINKLKGLELGAEHVIHDNSLFLENNVNTIFEVNRRAYVSSFFCTIDLGRKDKWFFTPAIRTSYVHFLQKMLVLPQFYTSYAVSSSATIKASAGRHMQVVRVFEHENPLGQRQQFFALSNGKNIPIGIGQNYMLGAWWSSGAWTIDVESYYRWMDGAMTHATNMPGLRMPGSNIFPSSFRLFSGESRVKGVDISLIYDKKNIFSMLTYTLSQAENRFEGIFRQQFFASPEDSRHQFKIFNTYTWKKFNFSINYSGATGRPYLDLSSLDNRVDRRNLDLDKYIKKLSNYHRVDLGIQYKIKLFAQDSKLGFSIFNVFDRANVKYLQFVHQLPAAPGSSSLQNTVLGSEVTQLGRTYNVSFSIEIK